MRATVFGGASGMRILTWASWYITTSLADISNSCQPSEFPDPTAVNPHRPVSSYNLNGLGFHLCPGATYAVRTIAEIVKVIFKLKNIRRAPGDAGNLARFTETVHETETDFFVQRDGSVSPWPGSMYIVVSSISQWFYVKEPWCWLRKIQYDAE